MFYSFASLTGIATTTTTSEICFETTEQFMTFHSKLKIIQKYEQIDLSCILLSFNIIADN